MNFRVTMFSRGCLLLEGIIPGDVALVLNYALGMYLCSRDRCWMKTGTSGHQLGLGQEFRVTINMGVVAYLWLQSVWGGDTGAT